MRFDLNRTMERNLNGGEGSSGERNGSNSRHALRRRPRNPLEEAEMLGELSDSEQEEQVNEVHGEEDHDYENDEDNEDQEEEDMEYDNPNSSATLPNVNREVIVPFPPAVPASVTVTVLTAPPPPPPSSPSPPPPPSPSPPPPPSPQSDDNNTDAAYVKLYEYPDILDCFVCSEPLSIPVYQCENGHILCSPCCCKVGHKCPLCSNLVGHIRCRAMEKVLESVQVACPNAKHGCKQKLKYSDKREHERTCAFIPCAYAKYGCNHMMRNDQKLDHEKTCVFVPCSCPHPDCSYLHNSNMVGVHFTDRHFFNRTPFKYGEFVNVSLRISKRFSVLQSRSDGELFIICNDADTQLEHLTDHAVFLCHVGPNSLVPQFNYEMKAISNEGGVIELAQSSVEINVQVLDTNAEVLFEPNGILHIPYEFFSVLSRRVDLQVRITRVSGN